MGKIIAIGGGQSKLKKPIIYEEIFKLCNKKNPKVLILPTAAKDEHKVHVVDNIENLKKLKFEIEMLYLVKEHPKTKIITDKILNSDAIFICGGNTKFLVETLKKLGVDKILKKAYDKGIILSGSSAGANCLFKQYNSGHLRHKDPNASYVKLSGLGIINAFCCPHYDTEKARKASLKEMIRNYSGTAIGLDECTALEIIDDKYRPIIGVKNVNVYKIFWKNGKYHQIKLSNDKKFRPLNELLSK
jgi:dipeptidase E